MKIEGNINYFELIPKYLSGNASDHEVKMLENWVLASEENKKQFFAFKQAWILSGITQNYKKIDISNEWNSLSGKIKEDNENITQLPEKQKFRIGNVARYAAAIIIILISSFSLYHYFNIEKTTSIISQTGIEKDRLPDGTVIALNQNSVLHYPDMKNTKHRRVELQGEAFFDVTRDTSRSFIVSTENITVEVLGTEFYIDARKDQTQIKVIVQSGTVSMKSENEKIILGINEAGTYDKKTGTLIKTVNKDVNYLAWNTGLLIFEKSDLESVVFDLNRKFGSKIRIDNPGLKSCEITATFDNKSLSSIIKIIEKTLKIQSINRDDEIILSGQSCN